MALTRIEPKNGRAKKGAAAGPALMKDRAYFEIKKLILGGDYAPGSFLAERQLAVGLGMSKTPVRAAMERLETEGFVTTSPQQGIVVREQTIHEILDLYEIRQALEGYIIRAVAGRLTAVQIERVHDNLRQQKELAKSPEVERGVRLDAEFHTMFGEFLGNSEFVRVMAQQRDKIHRVIAKVFQLNPDRIRTSYLEHAAIADSVIAGDGAKAAALIEKHLEIGKQALLARRGG